MLQVRRGRSMMTWVIWNATVHSGGRKTAHVAPPPLTQHQPNIRFYHRTIAQLLQRFKRHMAVLPCVRGRADEQRVREKSCRGPITYTYLVPNTIFEAHTQPTCSNIHILTSCAETRTHVQRKCPQSPRHNDNGRLPNRPQSAHGNEPTSSHRQPFSTQEYVYTVVVPG